MGDAEGKLALLAGASGLAGGYALDALLEAPDIRRVLAVSRRPLGREHPRLANRIVQFEHLEAQLKGASCEVALCCLGTTIRQAGSQQRFRAVDIDCVLAFARAAKAANAQRFVVISSVGADPARAISTCAPRARWSKDCWQRASNRSISCSLHCCSAGAAMCVRWSSRHAP